MYRYGYRLILRDFNWEPRKVICLPDSVQAVMTSSHRTYQLRSYCTRAGHDRRDDVVGECGRLYNAAVQGRRDLPVLSRLQAARQLPAVPFSPLPISLAALENVEQSQPSVDPDPTCGRHCHV